MQGIERIYCDVCIGAVISAWRSLLESSATETLRKVRYGKGDTLALDAIPEIIIAERLRNYDQSAILVTEELDTYAKERWPIDSNPLRQPLMFFSDPTDRSKQLEIFFKKISRKKPVVKIGDLMQAKGCIKSWEEEFEAPASITGATTSITCFCKGALIFSVLLNYITRTIFVASSAGIFQLELPDFADSQLDTIDLLYVTQHGHALTFLPAKSSCQTSDDFNRFVTFLGKEGYRENFDDSMIFVENPDDFLHHTEPGGPARILYLSELQKGFGPIGFILSNGEKIGEWIHWLAFVKFAKNEQGDPTLKVFEISIDRPWTKDGVLMSTSLPYSIFSGDGNRAFLDISQLKNFPNPSKFRSMLVITPSDNERIIHVMRQHEYREVGNFF